MLLDIILILIILVLIYGLYNSSRKLDIYENLINERDTAITIRNEWIDELKRRLIKVDIDLKQVDAKGSFEADDEVGWTFKSIKELLNYVTELK